MSMSLQSQVRRRETSRQSNVAAEEKHAAEKTSPQMLVFACIWTAVIAYFAMHAALN